MTISEAFELVAVESLDRLQVHVATSKGLPKELIKAVIAQHSGRVDVAIATLSRCIKSSRDAKTRALFADLLAPIYISRHQLDKADVLTDTIEAIGNVASANSLRAVIAAERGHLAKAERQIVAAQKALMSSSDLTTLRALQRLALASFYLHRYEAAIHFALSSATVSRNIGAWRSATACYSILYNIQHGAIGDFEEAERYARLWTECASKCGDESFSWSSLVAEYELAVQFGDDDRIHALDSTLRAKQLPLQYTERFALVFSYALIKGRHALEEMRSLLDVLREGPDRTRGEWSLCTALISLAHAAAHDDRLTRETVASAASRLGRYSAAEPAFEQHYRRLARLTMASSLALIGEDVRAIRMISVVEMRNAPNARAFLRHVRQKDFANVPRPLRGLSRVIENSLRVRLSNATPAGLTKTEFEVLKLYGIGWSAGKIARETERSVNTVYNHTRSILIKLEASRAGEAVAIARSRGLIA